LGGGSGDGTAVRITTFEVAFAGQRAAAVAAPSASSDAFDALPPADGHKRPGTFDGSSGVGRRLRAFGAAQSDGAAQLASVLEGATRVSTGAGTGVGTCASGRALLSAHGGGEEGGGGGRRRTRSAFDSPGLTVVAVDVGGGLSPASEEVWSLGGDSPAAAAWARAAAASLDSAAGDGWAQWLPKYYRTVNAALAGGEAEPLVPRSSRRLLDVGCGAGATSDAWRLRANFSVEIHCIEADPIAALVIEIHLLPVRMGPPRCA
jgi:hypothetical protein